MLFCRYWLPTKPTTCASSYVRDIASGDLTQSCSAGPASLQTRQGTTTIGGSGHPATFEALYDLAGPTYAGATLAQKDCMNVFRFTLDI